MLAAAITHICDRRAAAGSDSFPYAVVAAEARDAASSSQV
eukprot:CAMPEP_0183331164 /NCGR_PEP_ID=MMETSP0164_2-20130417/563_1 /TAXON_ID=221442 /ORGANISM="Coccolithus pelagicus ssp braarudi, Strain PLY182g" /LENGTH=39 /DNA_ID= /DNA_START= /DNA_END= /DNA_ORIENTATION=